jgi:hypothetical protein
MTENKRPVALKASTGGKIIMQGALNVHNMDVADAQSDGEIILNKVNAIQTDIIADIHWYDKWWLKNLIWPAIGSLLAALVVGLYHLFN